MATQTASPTSLQSEDRPAGQRQWWVNLQRVLRPLSSLRLTVALFALAIVLVLAGTLAQDDMSIQQVKAQYFKVWFTSLNLQLFFPSGFFPQGPPTTADFWVPFLGGKSIGLLMLLNLLAAHTVRFTLQARGRRLGMGLAVLAVGALVTGLVINSGMSTESIYQPWLEWEQIWYLLLASLGSLTLVSIWGALTVPAEKKLLSWLLIGLAAALLMATAWLVSRTLFHGVENARLEDPSMRILWHLLKGAFAGVVLLAGCMLLFKKRAGIVLLHGGVALLMISELVVNLQAVESRMRFFEGESTNYSFSLQESELAVIDPLDDEREHVVVVPQSLLEHTGRRIVDEELPFDLEVLEFYPNATLTLADQAEGENLATEGVGQQVVAVSRKPSAGTESRVDEPAAYVRLYRKGTDEVLGTYLLGAFQSRWVNSQYARWRQQLPELGQLKDLPETVEVGGKEYELTLRYKRYYHPYEVKLIEASRSNYIGTETPSDYSSVVLVDDPSRDNSFRRKIWMNNPLRYAGQTFYQSEYFELGPISVSTLQVVANTSWMIPYVSCMIVGVGLLFQFSLTLSRFLNRQQKVLLVEGEGAAVAQAPPAHGGPGQKVRRRVEGKSRKFATQHWALAVVCLLVCGFWLISKAQPPGQSAKGQIDIYAAGHIPLTYGGRLQPLDSLARNQMRILSGKQTFVACMSPEELQANWEAVREEVLEHWPELSEADLDQLDFDGEMLPGVDELTALVAEKTGDDVQQVQQSVEGIGTTHQPAIRWLMDLVARPWLADKHRIFRIENYDLVEQLGLPRRQGFRYSAQELQGNEETRAALVSELESIENVEASQLTLYQRKLRELDTNLKRYGLLRIALFVPRAEGPVISEEGIQELLSHQPPLLVPPRPGEPGDAWKLLPDAILQELSLQNSSRQPVHPAVEYLVRIFSAYQRGDAQACNEELAAYQSWLAESGPESYNARKIEAETYFNYFEPFYLAAVLYMGTFLVTCLGWLLAGLSVYHPSAVGGGGRGAWFRRYVNPQTLRLTAMTLIGLALVLHSWALWQRMAISGRPPVTNLYSSAVFIGWAGVVLAIVLEIFFRRGLGNAIAAWVGFSTLLVAHFLSGTGDTFTVMQAVLDTQFWLATHVVCVTLGYATTFVAGTLGIVYVVGSLLVPRFAGSIGKDLARMVYGILCFAIFFSFVGTVLGGLWADDSWGRFWGWDPKENGALIIVLWNALVLHARWAGMVRDRGLAVLAVAGNITTAWSWFGVNELGLGLHSYGFTEGMLLFLGTWCLIQLVIVAAGSLPRKFWPSEFRRSETA